VCVACGGDLDRPIDCCDHGVMTRGEATWEAAPGAPGAPRDRPLASALRAALVPALLAAAALYVTFLLQPRGRLLDGSVVTLLGALFAALMLQGARVAFLERLRAAEVRRFVVRSRDGRAEGWADVAQGRWVRGGGAAVFHEGISVSLPGASSLSAASARVSSFVLLRAALLGLASRGWVRLRAQRQITWNRPSAAPAFRRVTPRAGLELLPSAGRGQLPWLEAALLAALMSGGAPDDEAASDMLPHGNESPYRQAAAPQPLAPRWLGLGALLRAFHRRERAQPFHHSWFRERVGVPQGGLASPGGDRAPGPEAGGGVEGLAGLPHLAALLSSSALRRAYDAAREAPR
jgi:hypothetical protein